MTNATPSASVHSWCICDRTVWRCEFKNYLSLGRLIGGRLRLGLRLSRGERLLDGDGVDLRHVRRQRGVHHPVPLQQPLPLELLRHHLNLVARAAPAGSIRHHEAGRAEGGGDGGLDILLGDAHGSRVSSPPLPLRICVLLRVERRRKTTWDGAGRFTLSFI